MDQNATIVYEDNEACIKWAEIRGKCAKHIDFRHHLSRDAVENGEISLEYCASKIMIAYALKKHLGPEKHRYLASKLPMTAVT